MHVTLFSADETLVTAGSHWVTPGMGKISRDFVIPAVSSTVTVYFHDSDGLADTAIFKEDSWMMIRTKDTTGDGAHFALVWGQVTNYTDLSSGDDGEQTWTFTTRDLSTAVGGNTIESGTTALNFGLSGDGWWGVTTNDITSGPYAQIGTWAGANPYTAANRTQHIRLGDLNGISGIGHEYGLYAGISPTGPRIIVSDHQASFHQIPISLYSGTSDGGYIALYSVKLNSDVESGILPNVDNATSNLVKGGTAHTYYFQYVDNWLTTADYIYNTVGESGHAYFGLTDISHTLTTLEILVHATRADFVDDTCQLRAQIFKNDGVSALTDEVKCASELIDQPQTLTAQFTGIDTTASDAEWAAAQVKLSWVYHISGGTEVIKLEPNMEVGPYIAVGGTLPTGYTSGGDGFWVGKDPADDEFKMRIGEAGGAALVWDGTATAESLQIHNSAGDAVMEFNTDGDSYFTGIMTIDTSGEIQQGTGATGVDFNGIRIYNDLDIGTISSYNNDDEVALLNEDGFTIIRSTTAIDERAITFSDGTNIVGGLYSYLDSPVNYTLLRTMKISGYESYVYLYAGSPTTSDATIMLHAANESGDDTQLKIESDGFSLLEESSFNIEEGLVVGNIADNPDTGQLILDQGAGDGKILSLRSSDFGDGVAQGMTDEEYFHIVKADGDAAGAALKGAGDSTLGLLLYGSVQTASSATSTSAVAPILITGQVDNGSVGSGNNVIVMRDNGDTRWIMKQDGTVHLDIAHSASYFDEYDDVGLVRAMSNESGLGYVAGKWDEFVTHNKQDLIDLDIISADGQFVNQQGIMKLQNGAIWQLHQRIAELEAQIGNIH